MIGVILSDIENAFDELLSQGSNHHPCRVEGLRQEIARDHGKEIGDKFYELASSESYATRKVIAIVREYGYKIGKDSVAKHRHRGALGGCNCPQ
jgi:hypothetical protein